MISSGGAGLLGSRSLGAVIAEHDGGMDTATHAVALAREVDALAIGLTLERYKDQAEAGGGVGDASAMLEYAGTELNKRRHELLMSAGGSEALEWDGTHARLVTDWLRSKANSIKGGTSELMLSILSRRILGLPA